MKYRVYGNVTALISTVVEVPDNQELCDADIIAMAYDKFGGIELMASGGGDKAIGVEGEDDTIDADGEFEFTDCEIIDE
ncbi:MAG: hypothetical protein NC299_17920 [Lachnospiraceae bacterium]|nr:hypothetical protein [Ruminococcus sp.]MCM1277206.1 hypothetical protein [Lachnospiraceae bacterium]